MILESITLHDFGVYRGRQEMILDPPDPKRPITLIGGLNGGGKTTLLAGLQLALFGRNSDVWRGDARNYEQYLASSINRAADPEEGAGLELQFRQIVGGEEESFRVLRYWRQHGSSIKESVDVNRGEEVDRVLAESWAEWVEDIVPTRIAPLFFFDGERIEQLADTTRSSEMLRTAVHSLLGLDLVDQLQTDLRVFERRKAKEAPESEDLRELEASEQRVTECDSGLQRLTAERASLQNDLDRLRKRHADAEDLLRRNGGALFERRHEIEAARNEHLAGIAGLEEELRSLAAGALPLLLVADLIAEIDRATHEESSRGLAAELEGVLTTRDEQVVEWVRELGAATSVVKSLSERLRQDREGRANPGDASPKLAFDRPVAARAHALHAHVLPTESARATAILGKLSAVQHELDGIERKLAGLPDEDTIAPLLSAREEIVRDIDQRSADLARKDLEIEHARRLFDEATRARDALQQTHASELMEREDLARILKHSHRVRSTLDGFRSGILKRHVAKLERLVLESFTSLMRKQFLVHDLRIDPVTFRIELLSESKGTIPPDALSAGERQLLAISLLWGLSRASGRPLPAVIDTPLGRLDGTHRRNLVERYFPFASHQVLLLSTDEEIDAEFYAQLEPFIGRSYRLEFDDRSQTTTIRDGYFW
ncbi:MAG: DNA sulfur modification protein DndD [Planctomycetes bacterium]|nr:DNA sulfur modification protein DndD [Planctomycetota bacterium]